jgi:hypothetical protein
VNKSKWFFFYYFDVVINDHGKVRAIRLGCSIAFCKEGRENYAPFFLVFSQEPNRY